MAPDGVEAQIYAYVQATGVAKLSEIEAALSLNRFKAVDALRSLVAEGRLEKHNEAGKPAVYRLCIE
jgi:predicted transcriptional regulator